jgi:hypothetical protein
VTEYATQFGSIDAYEKGSLEVIDDDPKHYAFSNMFDPISARTKQPPEHRICG